MVCLRHAISPSSSLPMGTWLCQTPEKGARRSWLFGVPLFDYCDWQPHPHLLSISPVSSLCPFALPWVEGSSISHFCLLAFGVFESPLVFILFRFPPSFICMPSWCSWQVSEMPRLEPAVLMLMQCWSTRKAL